MECYTQKIHAPTLSSLKTTFRELESSKHKIANLHFLICQSKSYIKEILQALRFIKVSAYIFHQVYLLKTLPFYLPSNYEIYFLKTEQVYTKR